ncbi:ABC transporter permease [Paenibacillus protaetiae]|uniref:DUF3784 domain-containing protein n=1 Tax=Paenibacillus protaetiae TaxID=2509456 RepID=A0A4P6EWN5_9BACL|nr:ABC transporter permease [Paenibacillus protaetiae]QAY66613.1 hypothetical protein ET464_09550 [Paenibacillus protaetiae]
MAGRLGAMAFYVLFVLLIGLQLGSIRSVHRHSVWRHVYPLPDSKRQISLIRVDRAVFFICACLLWLPAGIPLLVHGLAVPAAAAFIAAAAYIGLLRPGNVQRKLKREAEEDE